MIEFSLTVLRKKKSLKAIYFYEFIHIFEDHNF